MAAAVSPLPGWQVIPPGWAEHHRPTANATMTTPCTVGRISAGPPPYPKPDGWTAETLLHTTVCRVQQLQREGNGTPGEQPTVDRRYLVTLPVIGAPAFRAGEQGDVVHALGRDFKVTQIMFGSQLWEIDLICTDNTTQQNPS